MSSDISPASLVRHAPRAAPGSHADYGRPTDDPDTLDYPGMWRIADFGAAIVNDIVSGKARPDYAEVQVTSAAGGNRDSLRAYLGTIPDDTTESGRCEDLRRSGRRAGRQGGDGGGRRDRGFAGQTVTNMYDYTYALDAIKIGEPVDVVVLRGTGETSRCRWSRKPVRSAPVPPRRFAPLCVRSPRAQPRHERGDPNAAHVRARRDPVRYDAGIPSEAYSQGGFASSPHKYLENQ